MTERFPTILCRLRKERKLNQRAAAADLHISQALLSHYENGLREPGLGFVDAACRYYGVSADYLLGRSPLRNSLWPAPQPEEWEDTALSALAETLTEGLSVLLEALRRVDAPQTSQAVGDLLSLSLYELLRCFDTQGEFSVPASVCRPLCGAAAQLLRARLLDRAAGETPPALRVPPRLKEAVENDLTVLRDEWR